MKKHMRLFSALFVLAFLFSSSSIFAQLKKSDLKAIKQARKEAKSYKKAGWEVAPGSLPMEKQLEKAWEKQLAEDDNGLPKWMWAEGNAVAQTKSAAELQALEFAKLNLAGQLQTEIRGLVENSIANQQLNTDEAASVTKVVAGSKNIISTTLSKVIPSYKIYKKNKNKTIELNMKVFYNKELAMQGAKKAIKKKLAEETDLIQDKLDAILDLK